MTPFTPTILLYKGTSVIDRLIKWQTRGDYSHAAVRVDSGSVIESYPGIGVRRATMDTSTPFDEFTVPDCNEDQWIAVLAFLSDQMGKPYDWVAIARFVSRQPAGGRDSWFCSELVFAALLAGNVRLLERIEAWAVSPQLLALSPLLVPQSDGVLLAGMTLQYGEPRVQDFTEGTFVPSTKGARHG